MKLSAGKCELFYILLTIPLFNGILWAGTYTYIGAGGNLNVATFDINNAPVQGVTTFTINVSDLAVVDPGDSVTVSLVGLQYPYAGDLQASLSLTNNVTTASGDLFANIGAASPGDPGYPAQFGDSISICSGNYNFDSSYSGDLWAAAGGLGSSDSIPCGNYFPTTALSSANDNLSFRFAGLQINGTWTLTIYDDYPPFNGGIGSFTPGILSWGLTVQAAASSGAPEPSGAIPIAFCIALLVLCRSQFLQGNPFRQNR